MEYKLNISEVEFNDIYSGNKKFLVRNDNSKIKVGDLLILEEFDGVSKTGNVLHRVVSFIENDKNILKDNFIILGITKRSKLYT